MTELDTLGVTAAFVVVTTLAATDPLGRRFATSALTRHDRAARAWAAVAALVAYAAVAMSADGLLGWLEVSAPTARVAAGLVLAVHALAELAGSFPQPLPSTSDQGSRAEGRTGSGPPPGTATARPRRRPPRAPVAGLVPIAFPVLLRPELALVVIAFAASGRAWWCLGAVAVGLATFTALPDRAEAVAGARSAARAVAALTAALAVATVIGGVLDL